MYILFEIKYASRKYGWQKEHWSESDGGIFFPLCDLCQINLSLCLFVLICKMKWMNHGDYFYSNLCILGPHGVIILIGIVL